MPFLFTFLKICFQYHDVANISVRYHVCQFLALILHSIGENIQLNDNICNEIQNVMLEHMEVSVWCYNITNYTIPHRM